MLSVNNLRKIRTEKGLSHQALAELVEKYYAEFHKENISVYEKTIEAIENNKYNPSIYLAIAICSVLDCELKEVFAL